MPYTLSMGLLWVLLAVLLGLVVGWLLRSVAARRQIERARGDGAPAETQSAGDVTEVERLRSRIAELEPVVAERDGLRAELQRAQLGSTTAVIDAGHIATPTPPIDARDAAPGHDLRSASAVLGTPIEIDDLTVIGGIGSKIAELCHGIGITTWAEMSVTEVSLLSTMLTDAGPPFGAHDPSSWPQQASLLAAGAWSDFVALTDGLAGGRTAD